ncbi:MAG: hypothetical protein ACO3AY_07655 [Chitinophagaceae bacterium]
MKWLRDEYAMQAFEFFVQRYFDKDFERFAADCELDIHETVASLSYMLADEMLKQR